MKKHIFLVGLVILATISQKPSIAIALDTVDAKKIGVQIESVTNKERVELLVNKYSAQYGVSRTAMMRTLQNENDTFNPKRQSELTYKKGNRWGKPAGSKEQSYGVAMIHLPDHPDITYEQATDMDFSIEFMAKEFAKGNARQWMGYSRG